MDDTLPRGDHQNLPPGCESSKTGSCPPAQQPTLSEVSDIIRSQIEAGFRRRREAFVREVFDKRRSPDVDGISRENLVPVEYVCMFYVCLYVCMFEYVCMF